MSAEQASIVSAIAAIFSGIAAAISAAAAAYAVYLQRRSVKPSVLVEASIHMLVTGGRVGDPVLGINVRNRGVVPVTITSAGFLLKRKRSGLRREGQRRLTLLRPLDLMGAMVLPKEVGTGSSLTIQASIRVIARKHVSEGGVTKAFVQTAAGDLFTGRVQVDLSQWLTRRDGEADEEAEEE
jgi:hypothetical protein